jgi:TRAP-type C4-dicarboxylate transport system permease small subunit
MDFLMKMQLRIGVIALSIFLVSVLIQIASRFFSISVMWTEEVANYSFIWAIFMGASGMVHQKAHFRFTGFLDSLPKKLGQKIELALHLLMLFFSLGMFYYGVMATRLFWNYTWISIPGFKKGYLWLALPVSGLTISLYLIDHILAIVAALGGREEIIL